MRKHLMLDLRRFDDDGSAPAAEGTGETGAEAPDAGETAEDDSGGTKEENETETQPETFDDLIKGRFKDEYNQHVQKVVQRRFKSAQAAEQANAKTKPLLQILATKYGKDAGDLDGILQSMQSDNSYYEDLAEKNGMTPDQYRQLSVLQQQNQELRQRQEEQRRQAAARQMVDQWRGQAQEMQGDFPGVSFEEEMENPQIQQMLRSGVDFKTAFQVAHMNEIMTGTLKYAVQKARQDTAQNIRSRQARPAENGMKSKAASPAKVDVSKLTKAQREDAYRRALRGEKVRFG